MTQYKSITFCLKNLHEEKIIAYPTEGVFGLGCDPDSKKAVMSLQTLKKRSLSKGFILVAANYQQLTPYIESEKLSDEHRVQLYSQNNSAAFTWVVPARIQTPAWLTGSLNSIAIRISKHEAIIQLCKAFKKPLVSTSANVSGSPPCRSLEEIRSQFGYELPVYPGNIGELQHPTEIKDLFSGKIIRRGG
ncbi:MAG: Sua5/YciO/YrdC/YwlC family protein [Candidatus Dasytiphilus stammeri]